MKRLNIENINTPELADNIFRTRWRSCPHWVDWERFSKLVKNFNGQGVYLDIGCFNSPMPFELKLKYPEIEVYGIDHATKTIMEMQKLFPEVHYQLGDVYQLPYGDNFVDYAVAGEIIEHLEHPDKAIKEWFRVIKQGGWLAISTPEKEAQEGRSGISDEHLWSYTISDIESMLSQYGKSEFENYQNMLLAWCQKI